MMLYSSSQVAGTLRNLIVLLLCSFLLTPALLWAQDQNTADKPETPSANVAPKGEESSAEVMHAFTSQEEEESEILKISDQRKREVMFYLGVPLLLFLIVTVVLGVAMGVYGKEVYLPHMIFAGLSMTLALAHAVVGIVWFYPF